MSEKNEHLNLIYATVRESINYRRSREQQIFAWSATLLAALTSALLLSDVPDRAPIAGLYGRLLASLLVLFVSAGSCRWQLKQRKLLCDSQSRAAKLQIELGLFDIKRNDGEPILPEKWKHWGSPNDSFWSLLTQPSKIQCTVLLGLFASLAI